MTEVNVLPMEPNSKYVSRLTGVPASRFARPNVSEATSPSLSVTASERPGKPSTASVSST